MIKIVIVFILSCACSIVVFGQSNSTLSLLLKKENCVLLGETHGSTIARCAIEANVKSIKEHGFEVCIEVSDWLPESMTKKVIAMADQVWKIDPEKSGSVSHMVKLLKKNGIKVHCIDNWKLSDEERDAYMAKKIADLRKKNKKVLALLGAAHVNRIYGSTANKLKSEHKIVPYSLLMIEKDQFTKTKDKHGEVTLWDQDEQGYKIRVMTLHFDKVVEVKISKP